MALQLRRGGAPFLLGDPPIAQEPSPSSLNVHVRAVLEILAEVKRRRPGQAKQLAEDIAIAERLLLSPLVGEFARSHKPTNVVPARRQQQHQPSAADRLRGQVLETRNSSKRLLAWGEDEHGDDEEEADEYGVSPYFESLSEQRNVLAGASAAAAKPSTVLKKDAKVATLGEQHRSPSIAIASSQGAVDAFLRDTVVPLVSSSIRDAYASFTTAARRSPITAPKRMKTRAAVSRRLSLKGGPGTSTNPLEGEDTVGYFFQEELPMLIADQVNLWWSSVRERMQILLQEASKNFSEVGRLVLAGRRAQPQRSKNFTWRVSDHAVLLCVYVCMYVSAGS